MAQSHLLSVVCGSSFGDILRRPISENRVSDTQGTQNFDASLWHFNPRLERSHITPEARPFRHFLGRGQSDKAKRT